MFEYREYRDLALAKGIERDIAGNTYTVWRIVQVEEMPVPRILCTCHSEQIAQQVLDALRLAGHVHEIHDIARKIAGKE